MGYPAGRPVCRTIVFHRLLLGPLSRLRAGQRRDMEIRVEVPEFHASVAEVRRTATALVDGRTRAAGEVALLLDGWRGAAASEFAEAWEVWLRASSAVASSLGELADALTQFQTDLSDRDATASSSLSALAGRLP